ncbi:unnamed protein product [Vitrella brassicaformis CCMP3155]|uniref:Uncharacterized protein n=1 Tax=Vitrella brassicaformis (strain CCMP3155) TaxID=1169540 RepID=A0A0G4ECE1_VITBC|nr:unnamed protein product [Vitrella brassicaformis CCMP3155]|eukprot:CEL93178.1 unnamed protein product [Vitrella brassicaformis CCMP3155]
MVIFGISLLGVASAHTPVRFVISLVGLRWPTRPSRTAQRPTRPRPLTASSGETGGSTGEAKQPSAEASSSGVGSSESACAPGSKRKAFWAAGNRWRWRRCCLALRGSEARTHIGRPTSADTHTAR